jgi:N-acetylmuramoyl-L-alanine amidase
MIEKIKNGKHYTNDKYSLKFIFFFFSVFCSINFASGSSEGKTWIIVIDPGHGGRDPGAIGTKCKEKDINLAIALKTGAYIEKYLNNVKVVYTRNSDSTVDLYDRPVIANKNKADLFVSIHANKTGSKSVTGAETYIMGLAKDKESLDVAMKENEVMLLEKEDVDYSSKYQDFDPKSQESYIMFTVMMDVYHKQSINLASKLQNQFTERLSRKDRGVKQAGFWVLFNTAMPSVLVETGFLSNPEEEKFLISQTGQDYMASAIFRACRAYLEEVNSRSVVTAKLVKEDVSDDSSEQKKEIPIASNTVIKNNNLKPGQKIASEDRTTEIDYSAVEVRKDSILKAPVDTPYTTSGNDIQGICFMVQVASSVTRIPISPSNFKGVDDISEIHLQKWYKYVSGKFNDYSEVLKYKNKMREKFPQAFIIALKDNQVIPLQDALNEKNKK